MDNKLITQLLLTIILAIPISGQSQKLGSEASSQPKAIFPKAIHKSYSISPEEFIAHSGVNLPWGMYSEDVGNPNNSRGFAVYRNWLDKRFSFFQEHHVGLVRVWIFGDARNGFVLGEDGGIRLKESSYTDARTLLAIAKKHDIRMILSLFDFSIGDGIDFAFGQATGEKPDWIIGVKKHAVVAAMMPFVRTLQHEFAETILCWKILNEPLNGKALVETGRSHSGMQEFVSAFMDSIVEIDGARVSLGIRNHSDAVHYWGDIIRKFQEKMILQFHYYKTMELDYDAALVDFTVDDFLARLGVGPMQVILGEVGPTIPDEYVNLDLERLRERGFGGVLFWQDYNHLYEIDFHDYKKQIEKILQSDEPVEIEIPAVQPQEPKAGPASEMPPANHMVISADKWQIHTTGGKQDSIWYRKLAHSNLAFEKITVDSMAQTEGFDRAKPSVISIARSVSPITP